MPPMTAASSIAPPPPVEWAALRQWAQAKRRCLPLVSPKWLLADALIKILDARHDLRYNVALAADLDKTARSLAEKIIA